MDQQLDPKKNRWLNRLGALVVVLAILALVGYLFYQPQVSLSVAPDSATIAIDNTLSQVPLRLSPGNHTIKVSAPGYVPYTFSGSLKPFQHLSLELILRPLPKATPIVGETAFSVAFVKGKDVFYYLGNSRRTLYQTTIYPPQLGQNKQKVEKMPITPDNLPGLNQVAFAPDFSVAMFKRSDGDTGLYDFKLYDLLHQEYNSWGKDIGDVAWNPAGDRVAYYFAPQSGERSLIISDRSHTNIRRITDPLTLAKIDVPVTAADAPKLNWSGDGRALAIVAQGNLYVLNVDTSDITPVDQGGVTSAVFAPDSSHLLYTKNERLNWLPAQLVNGLSGNPTDQANVGAVKAGDPQPLNVKADAAKAVFIQSGKSLIVPGSDGLQEIDLQNLSSRPLYLANQPSGISNIGVSHDEQLLFVRSQGQILAVSLDDGSYQSKAGQ